MHLKYFAAASLGAALAVAQPASAAPLTYDCQAHMTRVETVPPVAPGDADPWQCVLPTSKQSTATHWQRNSLEYCRLTVSVYDDALRAARRMAASHRRHQWIVLMDADETVLDNSLFDREGDMCAKKYTDAEWESWVRADMARDVPGAAAFTQAVHRMGGLIGIVTNRIAADDPITQHVLEANGIWFDYEIGQSEGRSDKLARWQDTVTTLSRKFGGHPRAVMWLGDQVTDMAIVDRHGVLVRAMSQRDRGDGIGVFQFLLANPMYGNWMGNPAN
jgi:5'-nucleotidase (lipoprotein e(P4) family)